MNWDALGAIAEFLGAVAVFITLAYLALQIRQNTKAVKSAALDSAIESVNSARLTLVDNVELSELFLRGSTEPDSLTELEAMRFRVLLQTFMWSAWNVYSQSKSADIGVWNTQRKAVERILGTPGGVRFYDHFSSEFNEEFRAEVSRMMGWSNDA